MDSLHSILSNKNFDEPPEMANIKKYVRDKYKVSVGVQMRDKDIVIIAPNAAMASTLRLSGPDIKKHCRIDKRLSFRIG